MRFDTFVTTVNFLSTIGSPTPESILINKLNAAISSDHNIFLVHSSVVETDRFVNSPGQMDQTPRCLFNYDSDDDNITTFHTFSMRRIAKKEFLVVVPPISNFESNLNLLALLKQIQLTNVRLKIGFFFPNIVSNDDLQKLFHWLWNNRIIDIFAAFGEPSEALLQVFNFNPFGTFDVINVTGSLNDIFPAKEISNFQQHSFRLAVIDDISIVQYSMGPFIGGRDEKLWKAVFSSLNATYSIFSVRDSLRPVEVLDNGTVDIHADLTDAMEHQIINIYPVQFEIVSMVVPLPEPYTAIEAYTKTATSSDFVGYSLIMIIVATFVLMVSRYINGRKSVILQSLVDVVNLLTNENGDIKYQRLSLSEIFLIVPLTFAGFIIVNGFLSSMQSHITQPVLRPQIKTIEDLYRSPIPIMSLNEYFLSKDTESLNALLGHGNFSFKMHVINSSVSSQLILNDFPFSFGEYDYFAKVVCKYRNYRISRIQSERY